MTEQPPSVYQYSVKLEMGAKGDIKPTVHVYSNDFNDIKIVAIALLDTTIAQLKSKGYVLPSPVIEK